MTLVEVVISMVILAILMLAMNGVIMLAAKATPDGKSRSSNLVQTSKAVETLSADVRFATGVISLTATSVELKIPDMDGNGMPDRVKYSWTGVAGDPLLRQYARGDTATNSYTYGAAVAVAGGVKEFSLVADKRAVRAAQTYSTGAEQLFGSNWGALLLGSAGISSSNLVGQYVKPSLPSNAVSWQITRVFFQARTDGAAVGQTNIVISPATSANLPSGTLDSCPMPENLLTSSFATYVATFSGNKALSPNQGACVVFQWVSDAKSCDIIYQTGLSALLGFNEVTSGNGGSTWSSSLTGSLNCAIYGTVTTPDPVAYLYYYTGMRVVLRTSSDSTCRIATTVRMLNEPQVSG